jgi:Lon protease-like protein
MNTTERYKKPADLPAQIPIFPLDGALLLPRAQLPLNIFEPRYLDMVEDTMSGDRVIGMVQTSADEAEPPTGPALCRVGCCGRITSYAEVPDNRLQIVLTGVCRFRIVTELPVRTAYRQVKADYRDFTDDLVPGTGEDAVDRAGLLQTFKAYLDANSMDANWDEVSAASNETLVNALSMLSPYPPEEKQALLEADDLKSRAEVLVALTEMVLARQSGSDTSHLQ